MRRNALAVLALIYHFGLPRWQPWYRVLPGAALATVLGNATGFVFQLTLVVIGIGSILARSDAVFTALKLIGAGYGRTGTMSLKAALERIGYGPSFHMIDLIKNPEPLPYWEAAAKGEPTKELDAKLNLLRTVRERFDRLAGEYITALDARQFVRSGRTLEEPPLDVVAGAGEAGIGLLDHVADFAAGKGTDW